MAVRTESHVTRRDVARVLFRHRRKAILFFFTAIALTLVAIAVFPRSYSSEAKLFIRVGRESVALDPTATTGDTIVMQKTQVDEVNSALDILGGRAILQGVVDKVGAERILKNEPPADKHSAAIEAEGSSIGSTLKQIRTNVSDFAQKWGLSDPGTENDRAIRWLESRTKVWAPKNSAVITLSCKAASPQLAQDIVAAATETFVDQHVKINQTQGSLEFFAEQVDSLCNQLTEAEAELRDRKNEFQLTSSGNRASIIEKSKDGMRQKIYDLQLAENDLKGRYTDEYPPLREIRRQREQAEAMLSQMPALPSGVSVQTSPEPRNSKVNAIPAVAVSESTAAPSAADDSRRSRVDSELQMLNDQGFQLAQLQRTVDLLDAKYRMHVQKLEQARVNDALGQGRISNINVAQEAAFISKPVSPKKAVILAFGLATALFGAVGIAFGAEFFDQTLRTTEQVRALLGVPVLLSLPYRNRWRDRSTSIANFAGKSHGKAKANGRVGSLGDFRTLVREISQTGEHGSNGARARIVAVIGCETSALRSRVAGDLAMQAAQASAAPVLLIDADAGHRNVANRFNINGSAGWCEVLAGAADANSCLHRDVDANLAIMGPGKSNGNTLAASNVRAPLDDLKSEFGLVVVDLPTDSESNTVPADSQWVDEVVLVVEAERTHIQSAQHAKEALSRAGVHVAGVVLTNRREYIPNWLYRRL